MLFGWWGLKRNGQPQKPLKRRPYFFCVPCGLWPPVRFCTVEALCRYVLFHSTPPLLFFVPHTRGALWKEHSKPGGDAKSLWTARSTPQSPLSSRISPVLPPLRSSCTEKFFSLNNLGIVPTTDYFTHPLTMLHKPACNSFPPQAPPKSFSWFGTHGLRPCKTATTMSDAIRLKFCHPLPLLLRRTTAQNHCAL